MNALHTLIKPTLAVAVIASLAACQTIKPNDQTLKERSEISLGFPVTKVSNVRNDSTLTYFTATTAKGEYNCQMPSGAIMAIGGMGLYTPTPHCLKEGEPLILR